MDTNLCYHCFQNKPENSGVCPHCGYDASADAGAHPLSLPCGTILAGKYIIGHVLGQGGFGITYIAQDYQTKERVAVKEFFPDSMAMRTESHTVSAYSGERRENFLYGKTCFLEEAETIAEFIGNPIIIRVYSYFEEKGTAYYVMEYVEGESLQQYVKAHGGKISWDEVQRFLFPVMDALGAVHEKGIIHRDVTPDNIYITKDGQVKLLDFGAARYSLGEKSRSLDVIIKHGFAPMEQYTRRSRQGPYTDVYAIAATMYYILSGKMPPDSIDRLEEDHLAELNALGVSIPANAERAIEKAMSLRYVDRFQSMAEFKSALTNETTVIEQPTEPAPMVSEEKTVQELEPIQSVPGKKAEEPQNGKMRFRKEWLPFILSAVWVTIVCAISVNQISRKNEVRQSAIVTDPSAATTMTTQATTIPETTKAATTSKPRQTTKVQAAGYYKAKTRRTTAATTVSTSTQTTAATTPTTRPTTTTPIVTTTKMTTTTKATTTTKSVTTTKMTTTVKVQKNSFSGRGTPDSSDGFVNLRSSMDYSDNIVFPVKNGQLMSVKSTDDPEWYWVVPDHSGYGGGYMKASLVCLFDDLKNVKKPSNMTYLGRGTSTSADGFLNVHVDASISEGNTVDTLPNGAYADVYSYGNDTWYYVKTATGYGYVKAAFVKMLKQGEYEKLVYNSEFGYVENMDKPKNNSNASVQICDLRGEINTHGYEIASFMTSYVVNNGNKAVLFETLKHGMKVKVVNYYKSYNVDWYELYAVSDGTYLGWVDANYIDFYE